MLSSTLPCGVLKILGQSITFVKKVAAIIVFDVVVIVVVVVVIVVAVVVVVVVGILLFSGQRKFRRMRLFYATTFFVWDAHDGPRKIYVLSMDFSFFFPF